ncbi:MAG: formate--phosphoribosylaminoimidazolecarboxamide ligase [Candidatus Odinarchaeum yellowstonii]|uniref:5-formaminoimidazole-4-carboxamide-1-(beta)-D-ribofuranosyl 5'-monophosphate synthetase n=1 Tax=Odinarchaeota yellowstonii (strain LCB_4) TaxID=1841599 RepID=A0AAF0D249_ODILC|nr:MAG: formate--phosphoribosylaminoimidazolecarboxamide ligase [Candidatus Odinarchaeum yellowstonii]
MILREDVQRIVEGYDFKKLHIATIGSHSALNIFKGAKEEGLSTLCICERGREKVYQRYPLVDRYILLDDLTRILDEDIQQQLLSLNSVIIPHGSFNAYVGSERIEGSFKLPIFGNRALLTWESHREMQDKWLKLAGVPVPKTYSKPEEIDTLTITKFPRAKGGRGYFLANNLEVYERKAEEMFKKGLISEEDLKEPQIQEYITGAPVYLHYFYSPLHDRLEFLGADRRYESNVDGLSRIPAADQLEAELNATFTVIGNFMVVLRESLLTQVYELGERVLEASRRIAPPGLIGPFCLETICTENLKLIVFEISCRIVAGCNVAIGYSPYTYLLYGEPMYMGRRIAREIKEGFRENKVSLLVT